MDEADVVVVGGGLAGLSAALRARQLGSSVLVLDAAERPMEGSNSRISGGVLHLAWGAMDAPADELMDRMQNQTSGNLQPEVGRVLATQAGAAVSWLAAQGVRLGPKGERPHDQFTMLPWQEARGATSMPERGAELALATLRERAKSSGIRIRDGVRVLRLAPNTAGWTVHGTSSTEDGEARLVGSAPAVVVASGGFQASRELMRRWVGPAADHAFLRSTSIARGDGLTMLMAAGASTTAPRSVVYGHLLSRSASADVRLWPQPTVDAVALRGLVLDRDALPMVGARTGIDLVNRMVRASDPTAFVVIFDQHVHRYATAEYKPDGSERTTQADGHLRNVGDLAARGAEIISAESPAELAAELGLPADRLELAVNSWLASERRTLDGRLFGMRVLPGVSLTTRGILVDGSFAVSGDTARLRGLYAAGDVVGVHGGPDGGYLGGLAVALVSGFVAGESASKAAVQGQTGY